jgi:hypothetical protein
MVRFQQLTFAGVGEPPHEAGRWGTEGRDLVVVKLRCELGATFAEELVGLCMCALMFDIEVPEGQLCRSEAREGFLSAVVRDGWIIVGLDGPAWAGGIGL